MQGKDHKESSVIGLALGMIVAALTTWLVMLLRQRSSTCHLCQDNRSLARRDGHIGNKTNHYSGTSNGTS